MNVVDVISCSSKYPYCATGSWDKTVKLWKLQNDNLNEIKTLTHPSHVSSVVFSNMGDYFASSSNGEIVIWKILNDSAIKLNSLGWNNYVVWSLAFSHNDGYFAAGSRDKTLKIWTINNGEFKLKTSLDHESDVISIDFSPNGKYLATASGNSLKIWTISNGQFSLKETLDSHTDLLMKISFSPDGRYLISGGHDKTIKIWKVE